MSADAFRPSSERFGVTAAAVVRCVRCGHATLAEYPSQDAIDGAYADAVDAVSLREEEGQVETARRALVEIERFVRPGRCLDVGCWTGSFLVAARERAWDPLGVEPSDWARDRAAERSVRAVSGGFEGYLDPVPFSLVVACDVLEHLREPGAILDRARSLLDQHGVVYLTVPDAGSPLARLLGRRWWSVLPMHLQYFTRASLRLLLERHGFVVLSMRSHPKVFSVRYYAERLGGYSRTLEGFAVSAVQRAGLAGRLVAPDLRDRLAVIARPG